LRGKKEGGREEKEREQNARARCAPNDALLNHAPRRSIGKPLPCEAATLTVERRAGRATTARARDDASATREEVVLASILIKDRGGSDWSESAW
jgi:hypothetical protein